MASTTPDTLDLMVAELSGASEPDSGRLTDGGHPPLRPGSQRRAPPPQNVSDRFSPAASYWNPGPANWVYRSMARYLRRHVVR